MNNKSIALNVLKVDEQQKISHLYKPEFNKKKTSDFIDVEL